jgi:hypothetical protein
VAGYTLLRANELRARYTGAARIVRLVVLQESKMTASATPPALHNKLSRLL